jgi:hypothetical protein
MVAVARWKREPHANIAMATGAKSGIWVLDADLQHGGPATLDRLIAEHGKLPPTVTVETPSGGFHLWWKMPSDGTEIRNSASHVGPGLDVRGTGGSIVCPPSILRDGRRYRWLPIRELAEAPDWLVRLALPEPPPPRREPMAPPRDVSRYVGAAVAEEMLRLSQAGNGTRNHALNLAAYKIAGFVLADLLSEDWARSELEGRAVALGLPLIEARRTIDSAFRAATPREVPA